MGVKGGRLRGGSQGGRLQGGGQGGEVKGWWSRELHHQSGASTPVGVKG